MNRRSLTIAALGVLALLALGTTVWTMRSEPPAPKAPAAVADAEDTPSPTPVPEAAEPPSPKERWRAKRADIRSALARRPAEPEPEDPSEPDTESESRRCSEDCWGTLSMQLQLANAIDGCRELLPPEARGKARYEARVIAEPGLGAVVDSVVMLEDTIEVKAFGECIVESAPLAELADPEEAVSDSFVFRYTAGPKPDNAVDFLTDHPEIAEAHPRLAALLERPPGAPASDEDATAFAQTISTDPEAGQQFLQWMTEQGVDLSAVRVDP